MNQAGISSPGKTRRPGRRTRCAAHAAGAQSLPPVTPVTAPCTGTWVFAGHVPCAVRHSLTRPNPVCNSKSSPFVPFRPWRRRNCDRTGPSSPRSGYGRPTEPPSTCQFWPRPWPGRHYGPQTGAFSGHGGSPVPRRATHLTVDGCGPRSRAKAAAGARIRIVRCAATAAALAWGNLWTVGGQPAAEPTADAGRDGSKPTVEKSPQHSPGSNPNVRRTRSHEVPLSPHACAYRLFRSVWEGRWERTDHDTWPAMASKNRPDFCGCRHAPSVPETRVVRLLGSALVCPSTWAA